MLFILFHLYHTDIYYLGYITYYKINRQLYSHFLVVKKELASLFEISLGGNLSISREPCLGSSIIKNGFKSSPGFIKLLASEGYF